LKTRESLNLGRKAFNNVFVRQHFLLGGQNP